MKNKKQTFIVFCLIIAISVSYLLIRNTNERKNENKTIPVEQNIAQKKVLNTLNKKIPLKAEQIFKQEDKLDQEFKPLAKRAQMYIKECGVILGDENSNLYKTLQKDDLSDRQIQVRDKILERCQKWYEFYASLSFEELKAYHKGIDEAQALNRYFDFPPKDIDGKILKKDARSILSSGGDESYLTYSALRYLFQYDYKFLKNIADELNIQSISYVKLMSGNVISLYQCSINYETECSAKSMVMMTLCVQDEKVCGMSFDQIIQSWVTPNNYADLLQMVDIIRNMVRQGFFDDALDE